MAYESMTYKAILKRMTDAVRAAEPDLDTREGSVIFNALAPAAVELANLYIELDVVLNNTFADTAAREYLILRARERGIEVMPATSAVRMGEFNMDIPIGSRFSLNALNYAATERISACVYEMRCETPGTVGNSESGALIPIDYITGLTYARLADLLVPGEDEESTESLRKRYFDSLNAQAFGGNIKDYKDKVNALDGVGGVKVYPVWNGGGTVRLVVIASDYSVPTPTLVDDVQTAIDPVQNQGVGMGIAPIGHVVTVEGVEPEPVNIATNITYQDEWTWDDVRPYAEEAVDEYFKELATTWESNDNLIVRISQIEIRFLNLPGVVDIANTTVNEQTSNLVIGQDSIAVRGEISG